MRVWVTGAGGLIGRQVAAALVAAGHRVAAGVRTASRGHSGQDGEIACDFALDRSPEACVQLGIGRFIQVSALGEPLPDAYHRCFRPWFALGWPAFLGVIAIFALMVWKPAPGAA